MSKIDVYVLKVICLKQSKLWICVAHRDLILDLLVVTLSYLTILPLLFRVPIHEYTAVGEHRNTVNSLMFAGINVCIFETKPCLWGLIFAVSPDPVNFVGT